MYSIESITVKENDDLVWTFDVGATVTRWTCLHCLDSETHYSFTSAVDAANDHEYDAVWNTGKEDGCIICQPGWQ